MIDNHVSQLNNDWSLIMATFTYSENDILAMEAKVSKLTTRHCKLEGSMHEVAAEFREIFKPKDPLKAAAVTPRIRERLERKIKIMRTIFLSMLNEQKEIDEKVAVHLLAHDAKLNNTVTKYKNRVLALIPISPVSTKGRKKGSTNEAKTTKTSKHTKPAPEGTPLTPKVNERVAFIKEMRKHAEIMYAFSLKNKDVKGCDDLHQGLINFKAYCDTVK